MNKEMMPSDQSSELPAPVEQQSGYAHEQEAAKKVEKGTVGGSSAPSTQSSYQGSQQQQGDAPSPVAHQGQNQPTTQVPTPQIADDESLIEKEWVESAKRIVERTKGDPHAQSEGINAIKSDYKKKRFNVDSDSDHSG